MAEAHSAVGFQFTVTPDGVDIDFNRQERGIFALQISPIFNI